MTIATRTVKSLWSYNPYPTGCVVYLPLWHPSLSGPTFKPPDPYGRTYTITTATYGATGRTFDGANDFITGPNFSLLGDRSYVVVVSPDFAEAEDAYRYIFSLRVSVTHYVQLGKRANVDNNHVHFQQRESVTTNDAHALMGFNQGDVMVFACTYNDTTKAGILYLDGVSKATFADGAAPTGTLAGNIGRFDAATGFYWKGLIGEFWMYDRVLSAGELLYINNEVRWRYE